MTKRVKRDGNLPCNSARDVKQNSSEVWSLGSFQINSWVCRQPVDWALGLQRGASHLTSSDRLDCRHNGVGSESCSGCAVCFVMTLATMWQFRLVLSIFNDTSVIKLDLTALKWQQKSWWFFSSLTLYLMHFSMWTCHYIIFMNWRGLTLYRFLLSVFVACKLCVSMDMLFCVSNRLVYTAIKFSSFMFPRGWIKLTCMIPLLFLLHQQHVNICGI